MDAREAIAKAKAHVATMFDDEGISNIGLEEIEFVDDGVWQVTVGFSRAWDQPAGVAAAFGGRLGRTFKVVTLKDDDGRVLSVKHRELVLAD
jgi:hypothetical protein